MRILLVTALLLVGVAVFAAPAAHAGPVLPVPASADVYVGFGYGGGYGPGYGCGCGHPGYYPAYGYRYPTYYAPTYYAPTYYRPAYYYPRTYVGFSGGYYPRTSGWSGYRSWGGGGGGTVRWSGRRR